MKSITPTLKSLLSERGTSATHYRVSWQDRQYKTQEKLFKGPDSEENRKKANAFAKKLEAKDDSDKYGNIRGRVTVKPV